MGEGGREDEAPITQAERASWPAEVEAYSWEMWASDEAQDITIGEWRRRLRQRARELAARSEEHRG